VVRLDVTATGGALGIGACAIGQSNHNLVRQAEAIANRDYGARIDRQ